VRCEVGISTGSAMEEKNGEEGTYPGDQALLPLGHGVIHGLPPCQKLKEHDAEAVHVALLRQLPRHRVTGQSTMQTHVEEESCRVENPTETLVVARHACVRAYSGAW